MKHISILLADDHTIVREGIRSLLEARADIEVVGEAATGREAVEKVGELRPDVVLMDISMPLLSGLEATRQIKSRFPECKVLVLTMHENKESVRQILKAGAQGYIVKKSAASQLFEAVSAVHNGKAFFSPGISRLLLEDYVADKEVREPILSPREVEILQLVAEGHGNKKIADVLSLSVKTIEGHKDNIKKKLGIKDRVGMIKYAVRKGIIHLEEFDP
jgi:two-component system response regulator NreC